MLVVTRAGSCACIATLLLLVAGCVGPASRLPPDSGVTFAAHLVHGGFMIDEMRGGEPTVLVLPRWLTLPGSPKLVVSDGPAQGEALWLGGPGRATVRRGLAADSALVGRIEPSWENNAIRLAIEPVAGPAFRSDTFVREDVGGGMSSLSRLAQLSIDVPGTYRAAIRDRGGRVVGWLRVAVGLHQPAPEIYEGVLPPGVDEGLAAASAAALSEEIAWIEDHTYDVYGGTELR
jgi:hypothetical protein